VKIRVWNHGTIPIILPGGVVSPGGSMLVEDSVAADLKTGKIQRTPPPEKPKRERRAHSPEAVQEKKRPGRRRRKKEG
jgi:hypothetical protein